MSKADPIKPTTKESYAMPKAQTSNHFKVLGEIPKSNTPSSSSPVYLIKEPKLLIQVLEADHKSVSGSFDVRAPPPGPLRRGVVPLIGYPPSSQGFLSPPWARTWDHELRYPFEVVPTTN